MITFRYFVKKKINLKTENIKKYIKQNNPFIIVFSETKKKYRQYSSYLFGVNEN